MVLISHNFESVCHVADRIVVLRLGRLVVSFYRATPRGDVVAAITGAGVRAAR